MWEIWAYELLPKASKNCPKSNKLPDLVKLKVGSNAMCITSTLGTKMAKAFGKPFYISIKLDSPSTLFSF